MRARIIKKDEEVGKRKKMEEKNSNAEEGGMKQ
jgi:hypothetical protein